MVQDNKRLTTGLRYPMQAAVDSDRLRIVVVLNQIRPRKLVGKEDVEPDPGEPQREVPFEDLDIIMAVGHKAPEIPSRIPGHLRIDIVSIPAEKLSSPVGQCRRQLSRALRLKTDARGGVRILTNRDGDGLVTGTGVRIPDRELLVQNFFGMREKHPNIVDLLIR